MSGNTFRLDAAIGGLSSVIMLGSLLLMVLAVVVHVIFAIAVGKDGGALYRRGRDTVLVPAGAWFLATLLGGVFVAVAYWVLHHSTFFCQPEPTGSAPAPRQTD
jgi:hypothetical protein